MTSFWATFCNFFSKSAPRCPKGSKKCPKSDPTAPRLPKKSPKRRNELPFSISLTFFRQFSHFISYWLLFGSYCLLYWFLLPPLGSYWLLLAPIASYCLLLPLRCSSCLLSAPNGSDCSSCLLLAPIGSHSLLLAPIALVLFKKKNRASRSFAKTGLMDSWGPGSGNL